MISDALLEVRITPMHLTKQCGSYLHDSICTFVQMPMHFSSIRAHHEMYLTIWACTADYCSNCNLFAWPCSCIASAIVRASLFYGVWHRSILCLLVWLSIAGVWQRTFLRSNLLQLIIRPLIYVSFLLNLSCITCQLICFLLMSIAQQNVWLLKLRFNSSSSVQHPI